MPHFMGFSRVDLKGVAHTGIVDTGHRPTVVFRDPDNIQLESFVHPQTGEPER